jgi:DNA-binding MarR family transcriptional regulator
MDSMLCKVYLQTMHTPKAAEFRRGSTGFQTNHMARLLTQALAEALKPLGLAPAQFIVLIELWDGEALTQKELMLRLDVEQATMGNTLKRMERDGLIKREPHPDDDRAQLIRLTPRAAALEQAAKAASRRINAVATKGFTKSELETLRLSTLKVIGSLKEHLGVAKLG